MFSDFALGLLPTLHFGGSSKLLRDAWGLSWFHCEKDGDGGPRMKPREPRRKVMVEARMNHGSRWEDIRILDVSTGGLCLRGDNAPQRGAYVELHRGCHRIIARVVWSHDETFGVVAQDRVPVEALIKNSKVAVAVDWSAVDRRSVPRHADVHDRSRFASRALQAGTFVVGGACAALLTVSLAYEALAGPMHSISAALDGQ